MHMKVKWATTWASTGCLRDSDRIIQIYQKDHRVKHSSALHSQPLHNLLSPSRNSLILRRRSLKGKDNPPTRGCGGRKCFVRISTLPSNGKEGQSVEQIFFPIKRNQNGRKIRRSSSDFVQSTSRYTSSTVSFQFLSS